MPAPTRENEEPMAEIRESPASVTQHVGRRGCPPFLASPKSVESYEVWRIIRICRMGWGNWKFMPPRESPEESKGRLRLFRESA